MSISKKRLLRGMAEQQIGNFGDRTFVAKVLIIERLDYREFRTLDGKILARVEASTFSAPKATLDEAIGKEAADHFRAFQKLVSAV